MTSKNSQFEALDKDFQEMLKYLAQEDSLGTFRPGYEKLYKAFCSSFDNERKLVSRCQQLNEMILNESARVRTAFEISQEDSNAIKQLSEEIKNACLFVEKAREREDQSKKMVQELKEEISHLNAIVGQGATLSLGPENNVDELLKKKETLLKQNEERASMIALLERDIAGMNEARAEQEKRAVALAAELKTVKEDTDRYDTDNRRKGDKIRHQEEQKNNIKKDSEAKDVEREKLEKELQTTINDSKTINESIQKKSSELETCGVIFKNIKNECSKLESETSQLKKEIEDSKDQVKDAKSEIDHLKKEISLSEGEKKKWEKKIDKLKFERKKQADRIKTLANEKDVVLSTIQVLERDLARVQKEMEGDRELYKNLREDNDAVNHKTTAAEEKDVKYKEELEVKETEIENWREELKKKKEEYGRLHKEKLDEEREKEKTFTRLSKMLRRVQQLQEECKLKDNRHTEIERRMVEYRDKAKEKEKLYEIVRSDRNLYSKSLIEKHDEINELKRKFDITTQQINQLKEELEAKDKALVSKIHEFEQEKQEKEKKGTQVQAQELAIELLEKSAKEKDTNIKKLCDMLKEMYGKTKNLQKAYERAIRDKDVFGTQLIRRNDELTLLCEKIKILQGRLANAEVKFKDKEDELRLLKAKIAENKNRLTVISKEAGSVKDLKKEIYVLTSSLLQERLQVQALSEELENPINIHRWRKLEGNDPDTYEILQKIQVLQKRLIKKTEEVVDCEGRVQEKASQIQQLEQMLERQPEYHAADSVNAYQQKLKDRTKELKAKAAELNMYQAQVNEFKYEIERLTSELQEVKTRYYEQKRREQMQNESMRNAARAQEIIS